jgi:hypothetical protein
MGAVPPLNAVLLREPEVRLVNQRCWIQGMIGAFGFQMTARQRPQFVVEQREETVDDPGVMFLEAFQHPGDPVLGLHPGLLQSGPHSQTGHSALRLSRFHYGAARIVGQQIGAISAFERRWITARTLVRL